MILSLREIFDILIMTIVVAFLFKDIFQSPKKFTDPLDYYRTKKSVHFEDMKFAAMVTAPAIILHEFGHKFVAMAFGLEATFHAAYTWLGGAVILKYLAGFIFFVPAYVSILGQATYTSYAVIAIAGPLVNLIIYLAMILLGKYGSVPSKYEKLVILTRKVNGFLFVFNMLPIPGFDGFKFYNAIFHVLF